MSRCVLGGVWGSGPESSWVVVKIMVPSLGP